MRRSAISLAGLILVCLTLGGCDKCGHPIRFNTPSLPNACYEDQQEK